MMSISTTEVSGNGTPATISGILNRLTGNKRNSLVPGNVTGKRSQVAQSRTLIAFRQCACVATGFVPLLLPLALRAPSTSKGKRAKSILGTPRHGFFIVAGLPRLILNVEQRAIPPCKFKPIGGFWVSFAVNPVSFRYRQLHPVNRYMAPCQRSLPLQS